MDMRRVCATVVTLILLALATAHAQQAPPLPPPPPPQSGMGPPVTETGTGAISGVVSDGRTGRPLGGAVVYLGITARGPVGRVSRQLTDRKGRFVFRDLPRSDAYFINTSRFGYIDGGYGRKLTSTLGARIALADGQWFNGANVPMWRPGAISGTVTDERGEPVIGVYVRAMANVMVGGLPHLAAGPLATTDDRGRYRLYGLAPGSYRVFVPSVQMTVPSSSVVGTPDALNDDAATSLGAIPSPDGSRLIVGRFAASPQTPGTRSVAYPPTFFPGTRSAADAATIDLDSSEDRDGVDVQLELVPASRVAGIAHGPSDAVGHLPMRLMAAGMEELGHGSETATTVTAADGRFVFLNVPDGTYTILASRAVSQFKTGSPAGSSFSTLRPAGVEMTSFSTGAVRAATPGTQIETVSGGDAGYSGRAQVAVRGRDVTDISVPLNPGVTLGGRVVRESVQPGTPPLARVMALLSVEPVGYGGPSMVMVDFPANSRSVAFKATGLAPGSYVLRGLGASIVKSVEWNGRDLSDAPLDASAGGDFNDIVITLAAKASSLTGSVRDDRGAPVSAGAVLIFPADENQWAGYGFTPRRIRSVAVSSAGTFRSADLPAGDYYLIAVDESEANAWQDPRFLLAAQPLATRVSVDWGETKTEDLRLVRVR
ncbi:MAG: hypothetical protein A3H96_22170 [Acidobacteria bacterium RIFCSPLOWO2_02_FULL_67_36]|nr:MAG: hypothetical protein A3H96_22170 [Acidobacteria bacterium RIFCSPLOWO2_02_FULL_67_36]